jgi:hypothetical protein
VSTRGHLARIGAAAAIGGAVTLFVATLLHPMSADPNDPAAAFAEYAGDAPWVATHLGQFLGVAVLGVALVAMAGAMEEGAPAAWARIGVAGTAASVAVAAALQAVDGVALERMVDRWAHADGDAKARAFEGAFAVRQVEVGMASLLSVVFGCTVSVFAVAMLAGERFPRWLGWVGLLGGLVTVAAGVAQAYTGFSDLSMTLGMPAGSVLLLWAIVAGAHLWRLAPALSERA